MLLPEEVITHVQAAPEVVLLIILVEVALLEAAVVAVSVAVVLGVRLPLLLLHPEVQVRHTVEAVLLLLHVLIREEAVHALLHLLLVATLRAAAVVLALAAVTHQVEVLLLVPAVVIHPVEAHLAQAEVADLQVEVVDDKLNIFKTNNR